MSDFSFNFDDLVQSTSNPFVEPKKSFESDERFYTLPKDADGNGQALIAFLPDPEMHTLQQVYKFNISNFVNGSKRFINMFSPTTCGQPDPIQEEWQRLWNSGDKEAARKFGRSIRYITNIKVIKDLANPDNEGKIFLYEMSAKLTEKLKQALCPSEADIAMGASRKEVFNPMSGYLFKLSAKKQGSGMTSYDSSDFVYMPDKKIYESSEAAVNDIKEHAHKLSWFLDPANYMSYDDIKAKLAWLKGENQQSVKVEINETKPEPEIQDASQPAPKDDTDALIEDLLK